MSAEARIKDSEGDPLPCSDNKFLWRAYIGDGLKIVLTVPEEMHCSDSKSKGGTYSGHGCLLVSLKDIFDHHLREWWGLDGGESMPSLVALLRDYADKFESALARDIAKEKLEAADREINRLKTELKKLKAKQKVET